MSITVHHGQMQDWLAAYDGPLFDSCVTDPPYHLTSIVKRYGKEGSAPTANPAYARAAKGFMGKEWDGGDVAFRPETWRAVFDKLKPGAHLVAFSGTRTFHRMVCAIEDAGFEIRDSVMDLFDANPLAQMFMESLSEQQRDMFARLLDQQQFTGLLLWAYGSGFPKSHNQKGDWEGWGTALKPALEPICLARKPLSEKSVAANVLRWGTGALNIDACRIGSTGARNNGRKVDSDIYGKLGAFERVEYDKGRWPANLIHDGSDEVEGAFPDSNGQQGIVTGNEPSSPFLNVYGDMPNRAGSAVPRGDSGSAARFFYSAKAGPLDRLGSAHATIKPIDLMRWLVRLVTPPGGHVLEPFAGSGTTGIACMAEQMACTMIEMEADHVADIERKLAILRGESAGLIEQHLNARRTEPVETLERACEISGLTLGEARLTDAEDARNPPPPEAFELIGHNSRNQTMSDSTVTADQQLRLFIERIERLEEERKGVADDIRDTYAEAKSQGYDTKIMRQIVRLRKMEPHDRAEMEQILETYKIALGMLVGLPLGDYALSKAA